MVFKYNMCYSFFYIVCGRNILFPSVNYTAYYLFRQFLIYSLLLYLLNELQIVGTPGCGFGPQGEGYFRLTSFGSREATLEAIERMKKGL